LQSNCTVGGVTGGYCASDRWRAAIHPASTITMDRTEAKIGRSMKNRENIGEIPASRGRVILASRGCQPPDDFGIWDFGITLAGTKQVQKEICPIPFR